MVALRETRRFLDGHDAQDAAQEAILRAWRNAHACSGGNPDAWVRAIARREALRIKASRFPQQLPDDYEPSRTQGHLGNLDLRLDIIAGLSELSAVERQALFLRYWAGKSDSQIATMLRTPVGTIKVRIHRANKKLGHKLTSEG